MDHNWQAYGDRQPRFTKSTPQQPSNGSAQQPQPHSGYGYDPYQTPSIPSQPHSMAVSPIGTPHTRVYASGDGDIAMEDADPYNKMKYPTRPSHQHRTSGQYLGQEDSPAARRYSPLKATPSSPYAPEQPSQNPYGQYPSQNTSARQSPTRSSHYSTPSQSSYTTPSELDSLPRPGIEEISSSMLIISLATSRQPPLHLPPIQPGDSGFDQYYPNSATAHLNAVFGREAKSPRQMRPIHNPGTVEAARGPAPRFRKLESLQDLQPRINPQPAFRRANPEGGFISVRPPIHVFGQ